MRRVSLIILVRKPRYNRIDQIRFPTDMKNLIVANWKSHKNLSEVQEFFKVLSPQIKEMNLENTEVVISPSFPFIQTCRHFIDENRLPVLVAAQNISPFSQGAYTGEVAASQISDLAQYVIIGHSERRNYFKEDEELIEEKISLAKEVGLKVILCVQDENTVVYEGVDTVAYEPIGAIGTGRPDDPERVEEVLAQLHDKYPSVRLLYGGSVDESSIHNYTQIDLVKGFLVGGASLDADKFFQLIKVCDEKNSL